MKGLEYCGIDYLDLNNDSYPDHNWYNEFASVLIAQQNISGWWPIGGYYGNDQILSTTWALITLEKIIPPKPPEPHPTPPVADAGGPYLGKEGAPITLNGSGSFDPNGDDLEYRWDFNSDGIWDTDWSDDSKATYVFGDDWIGMAILKVRILNTSKDYSNYTNIDKALVTVKNVEPTVHTLQEITISETRATTLVANAIDPGSDDLPIDWLW